MKVFQLKPSIVISLSIILFSTGCQKDPSLTKPIESVITVKTVDTYTSLQSFYAINGAQMQYYTINATTGGSFTTPQGTVVNVPANCFTDTAGHLITGQVSIKFREINTKCDMLLSNMPSINLNYQPLKSAGEFYIKAEYNNNTCLLTGLAPITVTQKASGPIDKGMQSFFWNFNPMPYCWACNTPRWNIDTTNLGLFYSTTSYIFNLYQFVSPVDSGSWCNSDNASYFSAYPQTSFTIRTYDSLNLTNCDVFLLFNGLNSMVHVYETYEDTARPYLFNYAYAPEGLQCTVVAVEVTSKGQLRAAFVPNVTITANDTINFTATLTTTANFKAQLSTYNH